jgi:hypothetical protein
MNQYSEFFRFDAHAHLVTLVIYLAALFETRRDTINLGALIKSSQSYIENSAQQKAKVLLAEARPVSSRLKVLRDNVFAHKSASFSAEAAFSAAGIIPDRLHDLIGSALQISNILLAARGLQTEVFFDLARTDANALLNDLAKIHVLSQPAS